MKQSLLLSIAIAASLTASADYDGPGYYRVENLATERWCSVIDNRGSIDYGSTTADLQAIKLQKDFNEVCCDPASVIYMYPVGKQYQIDAQGTGIHQIIGHYMDLSTSGTADGQKLYLASGTYQGFTKYLGDSNFYPFDLGTMATTASGNYRKWFIRPVTETGDNFLGVRPTVEIDGKYYATMYASFPFNTYSEGMKVYYISKQGGIEAALVEIEGTVPAATPVLIECSTDAPTTNRLGVGGSAPAISNNLMKGTYFNNPDNRHWNRVAYDPQTMRVLGKTSDGKLGFITADIDYIPANTCWLPVSKDTKKEIFAVPESEYTGYDSVEAIGADNNGLSDVYNLLGVCVLRQATPEQIDALPTGLYIVNGRKIAIRN
jgi:hypothetical protein